MRRLRFEPRADFAERAAAIGFEFAAPDGQLYWDESVAYAFTLAQIERDIEAPAQELAALAMEIVGRVVGDEAALRRLKIPDHAHEPIARSWRRRDPSLYGRFDFVYDGRSPAKMLEYNADTPTSLFEAAVVQWFWLEDMAGRGALPQGADQFNSLHEKLIARWAFCAGAQKNVHLAGVIDSVEDRGALAYLAETALQAGLATKTLSMADIGHLDGKFVDRDLAPLDLCFKLYPWEWIFAEDFGRLRALERTRWLEPPWKAVLSNKGLLALMWEAEPGHPNLLPAFFEDDPRCAELGETYARKPIYAREGANVELFAAGRVIARAPGGYGAEGYVRQALRLAPDFEGGRPILGAWIVGDEAAGMGIREDSSPITGDLARFLPHFIDG